MLPSFEKRPYLFSKRDTNPNWRELSAVKNVINVTDVECSVTERERAKNTKSRLHSRSSHRHDSLPTIKEPSAPDLTRTSTPSTAAVSDEGGQLLGSKNENVRLCIKRWRKMGLSRSNASTFHFEPLQSFKKLARIVLIVIRLGNALKSDPKAIFREDGISKSLLEIMEGYMTTREKHLKGDNKQNIPGFSTSALVFDPKQFKANKEVKISKEVKQLLTTRPDVRTSDQLQTVLYALQTLESFSELPLHMQQDVCKVAWLQSLPPNKVIIKQDHVAENFYFIINGTVTVLSENDPTKDSPFTSLATLKRGSSFGETAIMNNVRRTASVVSNDPVQLLVIGKEDYKRIFMGQTKSGEEPAHLKFCRNLDFLADWPVDLLLAHPENCLFHYFRRGTVIVKDSNKSDWLYVIVSGVCQILLRLEISKPKLCGKKHYRYSEDITAAEKLAHLTEERHRKTNYSASRLRRMPKNMDKLAFSRYHVEGRRTKSLPPVFPVTEVSSTNNSQLRKQTAFVQLGLLHPRSVFGLSTLPNFDEDSQLLQQASVSLVSRGAECVMISKKFFISQASELTKKWIRHNVRSYPSRETLQRNLQERINWDAYKQDVIQTVIAR